MNNPPEIPPEGQGGSSNLPAGKKQNQPSLPAGAQHYLNTVQGYSDRLAGRFDAISNYIVPPSDEAVSPENISRGPILFGMMMFIVIFVIFGIWGALAPIDSAAIAQGKVALDSNKKTIDHLEGGIIKEILVREGQIVKNGQPLIILDETAVRARRDLYFGQYVAALATESRLLAERDNKDEITFPKNLLARGEKNAKVASNIDAQRRLFESRRESLEGRINVLDQQIKQSDEEINGLRRQISAANQQLSLLGSEIDDVSYLLKSGNAPKTRLLSLQRRKAEIQGERGERQAMIARAEQRINEAKIEKFNLRTQFQNEVVQELKETQVKISDLEEQLRAAEDVMNRIVLRAPIGGQVTGLKFFTVGGVIGPGEPIMDIVPSDDKLIIEAQVKPQDIDVVQIGLEARVRLVAYKVRNVPPVQGQVVTISADRFENERTGEAYFVARIEIDDEELARLEDVELSPGMPAEVLIVTGERSFFSYLLSPIRESFNRAFREQ